MSMLASFALGAAVSAVVTHFVRRLLRRRRQRQSAVRELVCVKCGLPYQAGAFYNCAECIDPTDAIGIELNRAYRARLGRFWQAARR